MNVSCDASGKKICARKPTCATRMPRKGVGELTGPVVRPLEELCVGELPAGGTGDGSGKMHIAENLSLPLKSKFGRTGGQPRNSHVRALKAGTAGQLPRGGGERLRDLHHFDNPQVPPPTVQWLKRAWNVLSGPHEAGWTARN